MASKFHLKSFLNDIIISYEMRCAISALHKATWLPCLSFVCRPSDRVRQLGSMLHSYARQPRSRSPSPPPSLVKCHSPILEPSRSVPLMLYPKYCIVNNFEIFVERVSYRDNLMLYYIFMLLPYSYVNHVKNESGVKKVPHTTSIKSKSRSRTRK